MNSSLWCLERWRSSSSFLVQLNGAESNACACFPLDVAASCQYKRYLDKEGEIANRTAMRIGA